MTPTVSDARRAAALKALEPLLGEHVRTLEQLLPRRAWRDAVPPHLWMQRRLVEAQSPAERFRLHTALAEVVGELHAATIMELLPPVSPDLLPRRGHELESPAGDGG